VNAPEAKEASAGTFPLIQNPVWLAGIPAYGIASACRRRARRRRLAVVQPILATTIVFALPLGVWLSAQRITRRDVAAAFVVTAGSACPVDRRSLRGKEDAPIGQWVVAGAA